jgi:hypothetical protein
MTWWSEWAKPMKITHSIQSKDKRYYFRTRTKVVNGKIVSGLYGKIRDQIRIDPKKKGGFCAVEFTYYLNPTPLDRNMEFDRKKNLFPNERQSYFDFNQD